MIGFFKALPKQQLGILFAIIAIFTFATQDAITKVLSQNYPVAQFLSLRFAAFIFFAVLVVQMRSGFIPAMRSKVPMLQVLRCSVLGIEIALFAFAIGEMDLSALGALGACMPLVATVLAVPILGERVGWKRWTAVIVGMLGILVILRPGLAVIHPYTPIVLTAAILFGLYGVLTRMVSRYDGFDTNLIYTAVVCFSMFGVIAPFVWQPIASEHWWLIIALGLTSVSGHALYMIAFQLAEASSLQPFNYLLLVFATVYGIVIFGESLDFFTVLGALIVVGAGLFVWWRERSQA